MVPPNPFPSSLRSFLTVFDRIASPLEALGVDPERIFVGEGSAGGNLSAAICIRRQAQSKTLPKAQLLIYPVTDLIFSHDSIGELAEGFSYLMRIYIGLERRISKSKLR